MRPFTTLEATACPLGLENVDTDQLIPARFMSRSRSQGYGGFLLHDLRFDDEGARLGSPLDAPRYAGAEILVARRNFGTGSSREAAVYALADFGLRCVIAPSFGDIFASNAAKNGLLAASVSREDAEDILGVLAQAETPRLVVDLAAQTVRHGSSVWSFAVDPIRKLQLLNGWDDLDITRRYAREIAAYAQARAARAPWTIALAQERRAPDDNRK